MGPFETIELNAPGGVADYCERYVPWFRRYAADLPPPSVWDEASWRTVAAALRAGARPRRDRAQERVARPRASPRSRRTSRASPHGPNRSDQEPKP